MKRYLVLLALVVVVLAMTASAVIAGPLAGAIFTTLEDGSSVNANIYQAKEDVYLDGGPGPNAPSGAAALPPGDYYFQVTDPSGKVLLSKDPIESRKIRVNQYGVIDYVYPAPVVTKYRGTDYGTHLTGIDQDHADKGAITVQLMPYDDTPNKGGVYKAWITPVEQYSAGDGFHGFVPRWSKTDNFKVKGHPRFIPTEVKVEKFHDLNADGVWHEDEPALNWRVDVTDPYGVTQSYYTPFTLMVAEEGYYTFKEIMPVPDPEKDCDPAWIQTALIVDGVAQTVAPEVTLWIEGCTRDGVIREVVFGNVQFACVEAVKFYDANANGVWDDGEVPIKGFKYRIDGTNVKGEIVQMVRYTNEDGVAKFCGLLPGSYTLTEVMPDEGNWVATTAMSYDFSLQAGDCKYFEFGNVCWFGADFGTKGFWHNKNGLALIQPSWIDYVNGLDPYVDNPFDGLDADGNPVPAAKVGDEELAPEGTALAEISAYLVAPNTGGDPRIQLGQQLLAFIFNVKHHGATSIVGPDGIVSTDSMIQDAIDAWNEGGEAVNYWSGVLDGYNNSDFVMVVSAVPCPVVYY